MLLVETMDYMWCRAVTKAFYQLGFGLCHPNDTMVPTESQNYALFGAVGMYMYNGPAHKKQETHSDQTLNKLYEALTVYANVPQVGPGGGGGEHGAGTGMLFGDDPLQPGQYIVAGGGRFKLTYQPDGNLVLYDHFTAIWAVNCWPECHHDWGDPGSAIMQSDGNFVVYNAVGVAVWNSGTWGNPGAFLRLQDDGNLVIRSAAGVVIWETGTGGG